MTQHATKRFSFRLFLAWLQGFNGPQSEAIFVAGVVWSIGFSLIVGCFVIGAIQDAKLQLNRGVNALQSTIPSPQSVGVSPATIYADPVCMPVAPASAYAGNPPSTVPYKFGRPRVQIATESADFAR